MGRDNLDICGQLPRDGSLPDLLGFLVLELPDHGVTITQYVIVGSIQGIRSSCRIPIILRMTPMDISV